VKKKLWRCPECGRPFANTNQSHACGRFTVRDFLRGKPRGALALYRAFVARVRRCGPFLFAPAKTRVGFQQRMIFGSINKLAEGQLDAHVVFARRLEHPRFHDILSVSPKNHVHFFRVHSAREIDSEVQRWLEEAYKVGRQEHLS
jgi:hypothetical protein